MINMFNEKVPPLSIDSILPDLPLLVVVVPDRGGRHDLELHLLVGRIVDSP